MSIATIEQELQTAVANNDMKTISSVISGLTAADAVKIPSSLYDNVIQCIADNASTHPTLCASTMATFMTHVGSYTDGIALGQALDTVSADGNLTATANIIDNISYGAGQENMISSSYMDTALGNLANIAWTDSLNKVSTTAVDAEIKDFMTHLGENTDGIALGQALDTVSADGDLKATANIIDNLNYTYGQENYIGSNYLDTALGNLANTAWTDSLNKVSTTAVDAEIKDFMTHLGENTDGIALGQALDTVSAAGDLNATASIVDNLNYTYGQENYIGSNYLDTALGNLANIAWTESLNKASTTAVDAEIKDFMTHLGYTTDGIALGQALDTVSAAGDLNATASIVDNLNYTYGQENLIGSNYLDTALGNLANIAWTESLNKASTTAVDAEIKDFMTHLGYTTDGIALGQALDTVSAAGDLNATASIVDNLNYTYGQENLIGSSYLDTALSNLAGTAHSETLNSVNTAAIDAELNDFMTHLGYTTDASAIDSALATISATGTYVNAATFANEVLAASAIFNNITAAEWNSIESGSLGIITPANLQTGIACEMGSTGNDTLNLNIQTGTAAAYGGTGNDDLIANNAGDYLVGGNGNDTLVGGTGNDMLIVGSGSDIMTGGKGADTFVFESTMGSHVVTDFSTTQKDVLNLGDVLHVANPTSVAITNFVEFTTSGGNTIVSVSANGTGSGWTEVAQLNGDTGLNVQTLFNNHEIVA